MRWSRFLVPRRKENVVNAVLLLCCFIVVVYYYKNVRRINQDIDQEHKHPQASSGDENEDFGVIRLAPHVRDEFVRPSMSHVIPDYSQTRDGPGEDGKPVYLSESEKAEGDADMKNWFMNVKASDKVSLDRSLPDVRRKECKDIKYDLKKLPSSLFDIGTSGSTRLGIGYEFRIHVGVLRHYASPTEASYLIGSGRLHLFIARLSLVFALHQLRQTAFDLGDGRKNSVHLRPIRLDLSLECLESAANKIATGENPSGSIRSVIPHSRHGFLGVLGLILAFPSVARVLLRLALASADRGLLRLLRHLCDDKLHELPLLLQLISVFSLSSRARLDVPMLATRGRRTFRRTRAGAISLRTTHSWLLLNGK
ncbi:hypothetical protein WR25_19773 [Diploscapter pachys]|uniref:Uncharacterized protein n=1 Tax=Diploscapter pachys TaxID=2018661 RepID=A0A2A2L8X7_9BILA|nr:hypothetical protein WR25_19773 [Diploscapter pachys]